MLLSPTTDACGLQTAASAHCLPMLFLSQVDVPRPFSILPRRALTTAGNAAMTATLGVIVVSTGAQLDSYSSHLADICIAFMI